MDWVLWNLFCDRSGGDSNNLGSNSANSPRAHPPNQFHRHLILHQKPPHPPPTPSNPKTMRYPLADAPTPHILRKYTYKDNGAVHSFEESAAPELAARADRTPKRPAGAVMENEAKRCALEPGSLLSPSSPDPETPPTVNRIAAVLDAFEELPQDTHRYAIYNMCRSCDRGTLSTLVSLFTGALRHDILGRLPMVLVRNVLKYLDYQSLCAVSQVSRQWYDIVEQQTQIWKDLVQQDFNLSDSDLTRATTEAWGYTGWSREQGDSCGMTQMPPPALDSFGRPVNIYKAIYRRKLLISRNWMSPLSRPTRFSISCASKDVITCLEVDEKYIIAGSDGTYINVYDTRSGVRLHHFQDHEGGVWALKYIAPDTIVSGSTDRTVRVWSISKARCTHVFRGHSSTVRCLDIVQPVRNVDEYNRVTYLPPEPLIVTGSRDATLRMWRLPRPTDPDFYGDGDTENPYFIKALSGHTHPVRAIDGYQDTVVSGSYDTTVRVWRISTGECRWELIGHQQKVYAAVIDSKRNRCISASMDWHVKVWCIDTGSLLYTLEGHTSLVGLLDLNRTTLVSAAADSTLRVWDPETGVLLHRLQGHQGPITCFQHDEVKVVSGSEKTLKLWNIKTGELVGDLFKGLDLTNIWQVRFDARRCVSAVNRGDTSYLEILDFDYDPSTYEKATVRQV